MSQSTANEPAAAALSSASGSSDSIIGGASQEQKTDSLLGGSTAPATDSGTNPEPAAPGVQDSSVPSPIGLAPLPADASDEQKRDFQNKLRALHGVPSAPNEYGDFGFGDKVKIDTAGEDYKYYSEVFHKVGLNKDQAKQLLEAHKSYADRELERVKKHNDQALSEYRAKVKDDFVKSLGGEGAYDVFRLDAKRGFKAVAKGAKLSDADIDGLLSIMGDDPRFVKMFNHIGKNFREDVLITGASPSAPEPTMEKIFEGMFKS